MRHTEYLIVGGGIAGTLLGFELLQAGKHVLLLNNEEPRTASLVAAAVINPLIAHKWTVVQDTIGNIPTALATYAAMERLLSLQLVAEKQLIVFPQKAKEQTDFEVQAYGNNAYVQCLAPAEMAAMRQYFAQEWGIGKVSPVYCIDAAALLAGWQQYMLQRGSYMAGYCGFGDIDRRSHSIKYQDVVADKIIFCEGAVGIANPYFPKQHFTHNRGDVLLLSIPGLDAEYLYHKGIRLVPRSDGLWWCGSNYCWQYDSLVPDVAWRTATEKTLRNWLKLPCETVFHLVAERPTTAGQVPILAQHAAFDNFYFFNGLGTRGFSAGPQLAKDMAVLVMKD